MNTLETTRHIGKARVRFVASQIDGQRYAHVTVHAAVSTAEMGPAIVRHFEKNLNGAARGAVWRTAGIPEEYIVEGDYGVETVDSTLVQGDPWNEYRVHIPLSLDSKRAMHQFEILLRGIRGALTTLEAQNEAWCKNEDAQPALESRPGLFWRKRKAVLR